MNAGIPLERFDKGEEMDSSKLIPWRNDPSLVPLQISRKSSSLSTERRNETEQITKYFSPNEINHSATFPKSKREAVNNNSNLSIYSSEVWHKKSDSACDLLKSIFSAENVTAYHDISSEQPSTCTTASLSTTSEVGSQFQPHQPGYYLLQNEGDIDSVSSVLENDYPQDDIVIVFDEDLMFGASAKSVSSSPRRPSHSRLCSRDNFFIFDEDIKRDGFESVFDENESRHGARDVLAQIFSEESLVGYDIEKSSSSSRKAATMELDQFDGLVRLQSCSSVVIDNAKIPRGEILHMNSTDEEKIWKDGPFHYGSIIYSNTADDEISSLSENSIQSISSDDHKTPLSDPYYYNMKGEKKAIPEGKSPSKAENFNKHKHGKWSKMKPSLIKDKYASRNKLDNDHKKASLFRSKTFPPIFKSTAAPSKCVKGEVKTSKPNLVRRLSKGTQKLTFKVLGIQGRKYEPV